MEGAYGDADQGTRSEFAHHPPPGELALAGVALEAAVKGDRPVLLATSWPIKSVIAALVFRRAGVRLEQVFEGSFTDDQFERLANVLVEVKKSKLLVESPDEQTGADAGAD
jgi:hypothetical protein